MFVLPVSRTIQSPAHRAIAPQLTRALDRLFDDSFDRYFGGSSNASRSPAVDVSETDAAYRLAFDLPGVSREQLKVSIEGRRVTVESVPATPAATATTTANDATATVEASPAESAPAAAADRTEAAGPRMLYRERSAARYARTLSLPAEVDQAASEAKLENGVLTLTLAKKVPAGATQLRIA